MVVFSSKIDVVMSSFYFVFLRNSLHLEKIQVLIFKSSYKDKKNVLKKRRKSVLLSEIC